MRTFLADAALLPQGWAENVLIEVGPSGNIAGVTPNFPMPHAEHIDGIVIPGMIDLHSHAFQRALAGLTQRLGADEASFWTWRDPMYEFAGRITPEDAAGDRDPALHRAAQGRLHLGRRVPLSAPSARTVAPTTIRRPCRSRSTRRRCEAGIALTLLPVVYMQAGVDGSPLAGAQRRFALDPDGWQRLAESLDQHFADDPGPAARPRGPFGPRRAPAAIAAAVAATHGRPGALPIHIHLAEQPKEVRDCLERFGRRPWQLLLDSAEVDHCWCLVHGTHLTEDEMAAVAERQAVVGLCPSDGGGSR